VNAEADLELAYEEELDWESLPASPPVEEGLATWVVRARLVYLNRVVDLDAGDFWVRRGDRLVAETERGLQLAVAVGEPEVRFVREPLTRVARRASADDLRRHEAQKRREEEAFRFCWECIRARGLPMKLIRVEYLLGGNKAVFYFAADGRIDFRELVKDLAYRLHTRVEMRQIGVRDAAKVTGGVGICGRELCCSSWLQKFEPVSIRMAKVQNLSLNPQKVSGLCGRLMCCLAYEQETYMVLRKRLPRVGRQVSTPRGEGRVAEIDILAQRARVTFPDGSLVEFQPGQIQVLAREGDGHDLDDESEELRALEDAPEGRLPAEGRELRRPQRGGRRKPWQDGRVRREDPER
jgi:cell fate regulator YaaT (PSP1 superfamily)